MRRILIITLALALGAACSDDDSDTTGGGDSTSTSEPAPTSTTSTTAPAPPAFGTVQDYEGGTATAHGYMQPVATDSPRPADTQYPADYVWAGLDAEVCVPDEPGWTVSRAPWALTYESGAIVEPSHTGYAGFPQPEYPWGSQPVSPGQCVRGWVVFAVPSGDHPTGVTYAPGPSAVTWTVPG